MLLNNLLLKYWIWHIPTSHIYIFSKTASFDLAYRPFIRFAMEQTKKHHIGLHMYESIDMDVIRGVVEEQKKIKKMNMSAEKKYRYKLQNVLFIYDDILGDA